MTIDEAIKILHKRTQYYAEHREVGVWNAIQLGIEALNAILMYREGAQGGVFTLLPGETKD